MNALNQNLVTCAWPGACTQPGTEWILLMDRDIEYGVEFCADHAQRVLSVNPLSRRASESEPEPEPV